ncbi:hypothetical protein GCM10022626_12900 [[Pseudomonas] carboxydohydrogena]
MCRASRMAEGESGVDPAKPTINRDATSEAREGSGSAALAAKVATPAADAIKARRLIRELKRGTQSPIRHMIRSHIKPEALRTVDSGKDTRRIVLCLPVMR